MNTVSQNVKTVVHSTKKNRGQRGTLRQKEILAEKKGGENPSLPIKERRRTNWQTEEQVPYFGYSCRDTLGLEVNEFWTPQNLFHSRVIKNNKNLSPFFPLSPLPILLFRPPSIIPFFFSFILFVSKQMILTVIRLNVS